MDKQEEVFTLKLTAATVIDGEIATAGELVELTRKEAENLLGRNMAVLADPSEVAEIEKQALEEAEQIRLTQEAQLAAQIAASKLVEDQRALRKEELAKLSVEDLKALAAEKGHDLGDATRKADIIDAIEAAERGE